ncbi:hypothetical protein [Liquorilactobacillus cacaonum]|uniref:Integral membrane protein n=1 Tax=Liquorilactobacillus cacaonum DSM 21116 TaxID=1423729 RepID=A0A0R2CGT0_9LACO|nr:hypothetical protein [Liquorilactobacillus cacaonum]KRM90925.1 hypothetical protein FC80_GL000920 [Liquorilactobacillus cacaonum DSM 21116]
MDAYLGVLAVSLVWYMLLSGNNIKMLLIFFAIELPVTVAILFIKDKFLNDKKE